MKHLLIWRVSVRLDRQLGSNGSIAPQTSAARARVARLEDVSGQNRTEYKQKWLKPLSETLSGLWIGPLEYERVAAFSLLHDTNSWQFVNLFLFVSLWGKWGAELQENKSFAKPKLPGNTIFAACQKGEQLVFRAIISLEKHQSHFSN